MSLLNLESIVSRPPKSVAADVAGETVLMSLERSRYYGLGEIGSAIWKRLLSPVSVGELISALNSEYEAPPGTIERDVLDLLRQMAEEGLIDVRSSPGEAT